MDKSVHISTYKPNVYKTSTPQITSLDNNIQKKFAFLSTETIPDYRPKEVQFRNDKNLKTTNNQTTKFHQLQKMFGNICNEPNNDIVPFHKQQFYKEEDLQLMCDRQHEEIKNLKKQLKIKDQRIAELEDQVVKMLKKYMYLVRLIRKYFKLDRKSTRIGKKNRQSYDENENGC